MRLPEGPGLVCYGLLLVGQFVTSHSADVGSECTVVLKEESQALWVDRGCQNQPTKDQSACHVPVGHRYMIRVPLAPSQQRSYGGKSEQHGCNGWED